MICGPKEVFMETREQGKRPGLYPWALLCSKAGAMNAMPTAPADPDLPSGTLPYSLGFPKTPSPSLASDLLFPIAKSTTCDTREQSAQVKPPPTPVFPADAN